jgi:hypothetical protein
MGQMAVAPQPAQSLAKEPVKNSEVTQALQRLEKAMAGEEAELGRLNDRIQPVLCPEPPSPTGIGEEPSHFSSPLAMFIEGMAQKLERRARDVSNLVDRIAL